MFDQVIYAGNTFKTKKFQDNKHTKTDDSNVRYDYMDEEGNTIKVDDPREAELSEMAKAIFGDGEGGMEVSKPTQPAVEEFLCAVFGKDFASVEPIAKAVYDAAAKLAASTTRQLVIEFTGDMH